MLPLLARLIIVCALCLGVTSAQFYSNDIDTEHTSNDNAVSAPITGRQLLQFETCETMALPAQDSTFSSRVRGYHFRAPISFVITGIDVPTDASTGVISAAIIRFNSAPPASGSITDFSTLGYWPSQSSSAFSTGCISINSGDYIGVLGWRDSINSYGTGPYTTYFNGNAATLTRLYMEADLRTTGPQASGVGTVENYNNLISRVHLIYHSNCGCSSPTPSIPTSEADSPRGDDSGFEIYIVIIIVLVAVIFVIMGIIYYQWTKLKNIKKEDIQNYHTNGNVIENSNGDKLSLSADQRQKVAPSPFTDTHNKDIPEYKDEVASAPNIADLQNLNVDIANCPSSDAHGIKAENQNIGDTSAEGGERQIDDKYDVIKQFLFNALDQNMNDTQLYVPLLIENGFDSLRALKQLTETDLKEVGVSKVGHRRKIMTAVNQPYLDIFQI